VKKLALIVMKHHKMMYSIVGVAQPIEAHAKEFFGRYVINAGVVIFMLLFAGALYAAPSVSADPYLVKEYPDGTKVKIRWSQIGRTLDAGATHGGPPTMRAIQPGEDNIPEADPASGAQSQRDKVVAPPVQEAAADPVLAPAVSSQEKGSFTSAIKINPKFKNRITLAKPALRQQDDNIRRVPSTTFRCATSLCYTM